MEVVSSQTFISTDLLPLFNVLLKYGFIALAILYFVFSLIVVRQVQLMTDTLVTEVSPVLRAFSILHAGIALGIVVLFIGFL